MLLTLQTPFLQQQPTHHPQDAAEHAAQSRKDLHPHHISPAAFKALIEMGGASAQVTFMPDTHWHDKQQAAAGSSGGSKQRVRLKLPGATREG